MEMDKIAVEDNRDLVKEKLMRREAERQQLLEQKREEKEQRSTGEELSYFFDTFAEKQKEIENALTAAAEGLIEKTQLPNHFDRIGKNVQTLQHFLSSSTMFLRVYDIRKAQEAILTLQQRCQQLEQQLLPKKKFGFKIRKVPNKKDVIFNEKIEDTVDSHSSPVHKLLQNSKENNCGFSGRTAEILSLPHEKIYKKDVVLSNLNSCTVRLPGAPNTLYIAGLSNCKIITGPVTTSVFIENCSDCTFVLACQQLRVHSTTHSDFYLHVTSRTIIEDTTHVRFAPYNLKYENMVHHFQLAGLDVNRNNWDMVDDFNWLASDKASPNWCIMKENEWNIDWM
ncbi:tubulin-specific chaperone C [Schistocerca piceifrons]|uniref:tubulin-specific chaperone C n=1 Tax=Schistocerca piceifrons TaxID=274613 RepID=UPI001F5EF7CB|nr:tubulin-specific chaperone C [Schistocerca piceifrons]XP_049763670.1 tubulin-specific chaperone C [Schistocerca cancellata]XP_049789459.1 tubulin-specific chaperone C [Schistocerca nitens]XP_049789460.1 tubulin-specific chaperone C [Schistocerca nitens]